MQTGQKLSQTMVDKDYQRFGPTGAEPDTNYVFRLLLDDEAAYLTDRMVIDVQYLEVYKKKSTKLTFIKWPSSIENHQLCT